ncbi:MAG: D-glycero-alpha-D-manno-heptose-1,7-bisphosphate 7-phosphatase [Steroidobacterales bacterium]
MNAAHRHERVALLDRDGTIVVDKVYLDNAAGIEFLPGAAEGLRLLYTQGYRLVVITNQSGVGRGRFALDRVHEMNARLAEMVEEAGARLDGIYFCPHAPEDHCTCRKPAPGLILQAASELDFDPKEAVVIGDKDSDIECGRRVGATTVLISADLKASRSRIKADVVAADLVGAASAVIALHAPR